MRSFLLTLLMALQLLTGAAAQSPAIVPFGPPAPGQQQPAAGAPAAAPAVQAGDKQIPDSSKK